MEEKDKSYSCNICGKSYGRKDNLKRHEKSHEETNISFICSNCGQSFIRQDTLKRHEKAHEETHTCNVCGKFFGRKDALKRHEKIHAKQYAQQEKEDKVVKEPPVKKQRIQIHFECKTCGASFENMEELTKHIQSHSTNAAEKEAEIGQKADVVHDGQPVIEHALKGSLKVVTFHTIGQQKLDLPQFFADVKDDIIKYLQNETTGIDGVKWYMVC